MVTRRQVLKAAGGVTAGGAVAIGGGRFLGWTPFGLGLSTASPLAGDPPVIPDALSCQAEGRQRVQQGFEESELRYGTAHSSAGLPVLRMSADRQEVSRGETVTITLQNVSLLPKQRGAKSRNTLQVLTTDGWQDIRVWTPGSTPPHPRDRTMWPGDTLEWTLTMTEADSPNAFLFETELEVCPSLPPGRYRFVFTGLRGHDEAVSTQYDDGAVGVQFDLVEEALSPE